jgi:hypothetical protein
MIKLYDIIKGRPARKAEDIQQCIDAIRELQALVNNIAGPGLGKTLNGVLYVAANSTGGRGGKAEDNTGGTEQVILATQGAQDADDWVRADDDCPVHVYVPSGPVEYNPTTHKLEQRCRLWKFDRGGNLTEIGAEGDMLLVTTAVEHS